MRARLSRTNQEGLGSFALIHIHLRALKFCCLLVSEFLVAGKQQYDKTNKATAGILLARKRLHKRMAVIGNIGRAKRAEGGKLFGYVHKVGNGTQWRYSSLSLYTIAQKAEALRYNHFRHNTFIRSRKKLL